MQRTRTFMMAAMGCVLLMASLAFADAAKLMGLMPGDAPVSVVITNPEALDKAVLGFSKRIDPNSTPNNLVNDMRSNLGEAGAWVDFTKPMGITVTAVAPGGSDPVFWVSMKDFAGKVKDVSGAKEEGGLWVVPGSGGDTFYARAMGDYVALSPSQSSMSNLKADGARLANEVRGRMDMLENRQVFVHLAFESVRPMVAGGLMQAKQMAPMLPMMMGQQPGTPSATSMTAGIQVLIDSIDKFVAQVQFINAAVAITDESATCTLAAGFNDGPIKTYLAAQKPASVPFFSQVEAQPFFLAYGYHVPGSESPFFDFVFERMEAAMQGSANEALKKSMQTTRDLYRKIEGQSGVMAASAGGMSMTTDLQGSDSKGILELSKKMVADSSEFTQMMPGAPGYSHLGTKQIGGASVDEYALKFDTSNPQMAMAAQMWGAESRMAIGQVGTVVRQYMGSAQGMTAAYSGKVSTPLSSSEHVKDILAKLPAKRNAVLLVDPAGIMPMVGPMMGMPAGAAVPPGPPVGVSASISGDYARVDIHIPARAIERVRQAMPAGGPM